MKQMVESEQIFRVCLLQIVVEKFEEGALLLEPKNRRLFSLNPTAYWVFEHTDGQRSVSQIAAALAETVHISEAKAVQDIIAVYAQMVEQGLLEPARL